MYTFRELVVVLYVTLLMQLLCCVRLTKDNLIECLKSESETPLRNRNIVEVDPKALGVYSTAVLVLNQNKIKYIEADFFDFIITLKNISLAQNSIVNMLPTAFQKFKNLKVLVLGKLVPNYL